MNSKMTTTHLYQQLNLKKTKNKNKLSKPLDQEQNHRNEDHMEGCQWGGIMGDKVQGIRSINGR